MPTAAAAPQGASPQALRKHRMELRALIIECARDAEKSLQVVRFLEDLPSLHEPAEFLRAAQLEAEAKSIRGFAWARALAAS